MAERHSTYVTDPRAPDEDYFLSIHFDVTSYGHAPHGYGENFDPGSGPEFEIVAAFDDASAPILGDLPDDAVEAIEKQLIESFDWRAAQRDEREFD